MHNPGFYFARTDISGMTGKIQIESVDYTEFNQCWVPDFDNYMVIITW